MRGVISVEEALERMLARVDVLGDERVELMGALHRVLAEPIASDRDMPPWPNSSMDGYALRERRRARGDGGPTGDASAGRPRGRRRHGRSGRCGRERRSGSSPGRRSRMAPTR